MKKILLYSFLLFLSYFQLTIPSQYKTSHDNRELFENKTILITGGTGFLGRTLTEEILKYNPRLIKIFSRDEVKHYKCKILFKNNHKIEYILGNIRDHNALLQHTHNVDLVIHTAALKRVDSLEYNVEESIKTNILGSLNIFKACIANKVNKVIFVSTDKACSPVNIYGACKFASEKIFTNYDYKNINTKFITVRYGNVLESTGSVIPLFTNKIKNGEEITLTDPRMTRFIVGKDEAVALIFDAIRYGVGGEIFSKHFPAMTVVDLIEILKEKYNANNPVHIIGLRPGEKIHEILVNETEVTRTYSFKDLRIIMPYLASWIKNLKNNNTIPAYMQEGIVLEEKDTPDYSSGNSIVSRDKIKAIFKKLLIY